MCEQDTVYSMIFTLNFTFSQNAYILKKTYCIFQYNYCRCFGFVFSKKLLKISMIKTAILPPNKLINSSYSCFYWHISVFATMKRSKSGINQILSIIIMTFVHSCHATLIKCSSTLNSCRGILKANKSQSLHYNNGEASQHWILLEHSACNSRNPYGNVKRKGKSYLQYCQHKGASVCRER